MCQKMTNKQKLEALNKLLDMAQKITVYDSDNPDFKNWKYDEPWV